MKNSKATPRVYIAEDDENIREIVHYALQSAGFKVSAFETGTDFFAAVENIAPDLALLDIMLPGEDGLSILQRLRSIQQTKALPIIMLTAKGSELDKVKGLDMGADDYITKPFSVMELISRVNAVIRRAMQDQSHVGNFSLGGLTIRDDRREVCVDGESVALTYKEYELLSYMALNAGLALSRDKIMDSVWGYDSECESRTLDMHIKSLRKKLLKAGAYIHTIRNFGYRFEE